MSAGLDTCVHEITYDIPCPYCGCSNEMTYDVDDEKPNPYHENFYCKECHEKFWVRKD